MDLQKFRLYLKRISGVAQQQTGISSAFCGSVEPNVKLGSLGRFDIQALAASGQIPPQTLAALHAELLGRPTGNLVPALDQPTLLHATLQGPKRGPVEHSVPFGQPLVKCQTNISKHFPPSILPVEDVSSGFGAWPSNSLGTVGSSINLGGLSTQNSNTLMDILQQQQQKQLQTQQQSVLSESSRSINVQPSCLVVPQTSPGFQLGNSPASVNQNCSFNRNTVIDYSILSSQSSDSSVNVGQISNGDIKATGILSGYSTPASCSSLSSCSLNATTSTTHQSSTVTFGDARRFPGLVSNTSNIQGSYDAKPGEVLDQGPLKNLGFVGKGTCIPSRFAVDEFESSPSNMNQGKVNLEKNGNTVKQEPNMDFLDNAKIGVPILRQYSSNELMSVFTE